MPRKVCAVGMQTYEIIDSIWFPLTTFSYEDCGSLHTIGIVKVRDKLTMETKYYIGASHGEDIEYDEQIVAACGAPFEACGSFAEIYTLMKLKETQ